MIWVASGNYGILLLVNHGSIAQLAEHDTLNVGVVGSRPTRVTSFSPLGLFYCESSLTLPTWRNW